MALLALLLALSASASTWTAFDAAGFEAAKRADRIVLLQFLDRDCTACAEQDKVLSRIFWGSARTDWQGYQVDLVRNPEVARAFGVSGRSTLVLLKGTREVARTVGIIQTSELNAFLRQADIPEPRGRAPARPRNRLPPRP